MTGPEEGLLSHLRRYWLAPAMPMGGPLRLARSYGRYLRDWSRYRRMAGAERLRLRDSYPCLRDRTGVTRIKGHYFHQDVWAFKKIHAAGPELHVDVGSRAILVGMLTAITRVEFVDIRPLDVQLDGLTVRRGSLLDLPFPDRSIASLSCLHVAEHVGLGRYGDPLDPAGTGRAIRELSRVLAAGGDLYFSLPVGRARVCFNAHRIHDPTAVVDLFEGLALVDFAGVDEDGRFLPAVRPRDLAGASYACGLFHFRRPGREAS